MINTDQGVENKEDGFAAIVYERKIDHAERRIVDEIGIGKLDGT